MPELIVFNKLTHFMNRLAVETFKIFRVTLVLHDLSIVVLMDCFHARLYWSGLHWSASILLNSK